MIWNGEAALALADERDLFRLLGMEYLEPWERQQGGSG